MTRAALVLLVPGCGAGGGDPAGELGASDGEDGPLESSTGTTGSNDAGSSPDGDGGTWSTSFGDSSGGAEDTGFGMDDDMPLVTAIPEIKGGQIAVGTLVEIQKVRVITPEGNAAHGGLLEVYVQEPEGGARSGILVRLDGPLSLGLVPGDEVTVEGTVRRAEGVRYLLASTEDITISSWQGDLGPAVLDTADLVPYDPVIMDYEGSLVRVEDVDVTRLLSTGEPVIDDVLYLDDRFAGELPMVGVGQALGSITGALMVTPSGLAIGPRSSDEVVQ